MTISIEELEYIAKLARIELDKNDRERFNEKLSSVITYIEKIKGIDLENVEPTYSPIPLNNVFREDERKPSLDRESLLMNAPKKREGYFQVPKMVD